MPTSAELNTLAWRTKACRRVGCAQPAGRRCVNAAGTRIPPHPERLADLVDDLGAQVDELQHALDSMTGERDTLKAQNGDLSRRVGEAADDLTGVRQQLTSVSGQLDDTRKQLKAALERIDDLERPPTPFGLRFGIGISEKPTSAAAPLPHTLVQLEADAGVKFAYVREYFTFSSTMLTSSAVDWCQTQLMAGRIPIVSFKLPGSWADTAAGKYDKGIKATIDALEAAASDAGSRVVVAVHHEPDNGDGKLADFKAMTSHLLPLIKRPGLVEYWTCETGYYDAGSEWQMGSSYVPGIDGIGFDPYLTLGQIKDGTMSNTTKLTNQRTQYYEKFAAVAAKLGCQWGIWETGESEFAAASKIAGAGSFIGDCADDAKALGAAMWCYWNNKKTAVMTDWRISTTAPGNKHGQLVAAMRKHAH